MDRQQAREYINSNPQKHLQRAPKKVQGNYTYICPFCGNGSGTSGDGLTSKDGTHWHCFKCGFNGDMIELIAKEKGIKDGGSLQAFEAAREVYGIDQVDNTPYTQYKQNADNKQRTQEKDIMKADKSDFIKKHSGEGADLSYLEARGISKATARALQFGYNPQHKAIIIPISNDEGLFYIERYTDHRQDASGNAVRYSIPRGTKSGIFNEKALDGAGPVFITEGAINAASIIEAGGQALAINSTSNAQGFLRKLKTRGSNCKKFIICMDNDEAGAAAKQTLFDGLKELGYEATEYMPAEHNDVNDELRFNKEKFRASVCRAVNSFDKEKTEEINRHKVGALTAGFWKYVHEAQNNKPIKTGFEKFDIAIGGGLLPKFYIIGAITSLGKTTFTMQIADNIAESGNDVIIFSLEMGSEDLIARSVSRHTYINTVKSGGNSALAKTELGIIMGSRYANYSEAEINTITQAYNDYAAYAEEHISIYEGKHTADRIKEIVKQYIDITGKIPVVIVDYLQILQPPKELLRATAKEQTDYNIDIFASMRRELKTPVIGISSFNRQSYTTVADGSSFKESGTIEYSGDCIITLELDYERITGKQFSDSEKTNKTKDKIKEAMRANPREIKLTFQKNRGNRVGTTLYYKYNAMFNYFEEDLDKENEL